MQFSVVNYKKTIEEGLRLDSDFYRDDYLQIEQKLSKYDNLSEITNTYELHSNGAFADIFRILHKDNSLEIRYIRSENVGDFFINGDVDFISSYAHKNLEKTQTKLGDILTARTGKVGGASVVTNEWVNVNSNQNVVNIRIKNKAVISPNYITTFLNTYYGIKQFHRASTGNVQPWLNLSLLRKVKIYIASFKFQLQISNLIDKALFVSDQSKSLYSQAEKLLLEKLGLINWKPKHELTFIKKYSDMQKSDRFDAEFYEPKYEEIVLAIKKYKNGFDELGKLVIPRKSIEPGSETYQESGIPFVRVSNLSKFEISDNNQQFINEELYNQLKHLQPKKGEILLSKDATPGMAYYLNDEPQAMIVSGGILRLKMNSQKVLPEYLTLVLNSVIVQKQIERDAGGSIINHWRPDQINSTLIPILKNEKQEEIKELIEKSFKNRYLSKSLLEIAKRGVEIAIEKNEAEAEKWINEQISQLNISL